MPCSNKNCPKQDTTNSSLRCSRCKKASYCSKECQKDDWKKHKTSCSPSLKVDPIDFKMMLSEIKAVDPDKIGDYHLLITKILSELGKREDKQYSQLIRTLRPKLGIPLESFPEKSPCCIITGKQVTESTSLMLASPEFTDFHPAPKNFAFFMFLFSGLFFNKNGVMNSVGHFGPSTLKTNPSKKEMVDLYRNTISKYGLPFFCNTFLSMQVDHYKESICKSEMVKLDPDKDKAFHQTGGIFAIPKDLDSIYYLIRKLRELGIKGIVDPFCGGGFFAALLVICGWSPDAIFTSDINSGQKPDYISMVGGKRYLCDATQKTIYEKAIRKLGLPPGEIAIILNWPDQPPTKPSIGALEQINVFGFRIIIEGSEIKGCAICNESTEELDKWNKTTVSSVWVGNAFTGGPNNIFICERRQERLI